MFLNLVFCVVYCRSLFVYFSFDLYTLFLSCVGEKHSLSTLKVGRVSLVSSSLLPVLITAAYYLHCVRSQPTLDAYKNDVLDWWLWQNTFPLSTVLAGHSYFPCHDIYVILLKVVLNLIRNNHSNNSPIIFQK